MKQKELLTFMMILNSAKPLGLMLDQRCGRLPNNKPTLIQRLSSAG